ncbi:tandem-type lipoprotein [Enterococcus silesiacus]|nr:tandem-type lipoprotein [Enterococcus silesiacus]
MKKLYLFIGGLIIMSGLTGCETKNKAEIEQSFDKVLAMYPTPNLESFYDMEGYRDNEFDKDDKGVWVLQTNMSIAYEADGDVYSEGAVLRINRNIREAKGFYFVRKYYDDVKKRIEENKYPITFDEQGIHLIDELHDKELSNKIKKFQFFVQYGNFKQIDTYKNIKEMYNPEVPMYELEYKLTTDNPNVIALKKRYDIPTDSVPTLLLKGTGDLNGSSVGNKNIEFRYSKNPNVVFRDYVNFQPLSEEDIINE